MILYSWFTEHSQRPSNTKKLQDVIQQNSLIWPIAKVRKTITPKRQNTPKYKYINKEALNNNGLPSYINNEIYKN